MLKNNFKIIFILIIALFFIFTAGVLCNSNFKQYTLALVNGKYERLTTENQDIIMDDWNYLDEDFLLRDGTNVNNNFDLLDGDGVSQHKIVKLSVNSSEDNDLANVQFVNENLASAQGGDTYVNWGRGDCPEGDQILYSGYGFSVVIANLSGGNNPICIDNLLESSEHFSGSYRDALKPLVTDNHAELPLGIPQRRNIKCAVCYKPQSTCFLNAGSHSCVSGFDNVYSGFFMSETSNMNRNSLRRLCLNQNFDLSSEISLMSVGAKLYSSRIQENFGNVAYPDCETGGQCNFVKCSVCCN